MQIKLISLTIVEHQDSLRNRDKQQLGNGPLRERLGCKATSLRSWGYCWRGEWGGALWYFTASLPIVRAAFVYRANNRELKIYDDDVDENATKQ